MCSICAFKDRAELGGLDEEDIVTPSPGEPTPSESSESGSQLSHGASWRKRGREASDRMEEDVAASDAQELSRTLAELSRGLALAGQEDRHWEEHMEQLQEQVDQEAAALSQLQVWLADSFEQLFH